LPDDGFSAGRVYVTLLHGGSRREPSAFIDVLLQAREIGRVIFLHKAVTVGAAEIENVMRILIDERKIILHGLANIFADHLGILPSPFRIEVGVTDYVKGRLLAQIGFVSRLRKRRGEQHQAGERNGY
jgi:hypothetical protein